MKNNQTVYTYSSTNKFGLYRNIFIIFIVLLLLSIVLTGCMPNAENYPPEDPAGFFSGIWHGWIAPFSLFFSFFGDGGIYAVNNTGFPYDFGFYMAIISGFGGLSFSRNRFRRSTTYYSNMDSSQQSFKYDNEV